jgi:hypothetical protein
MVGGFWTLGVLGVTELSARYGEGLLGFYLEVGYTVESCHHEIVGISVYDTENWGDLYSWV